MKIRIGFISNSSSTSFLLKGKQIDIKDLDEDTFLFSKYLVIGTHNVGEGDDIFDLDREMYLVLKHLPIKWSQLVLWEVFDKVYEDDEVNPIDKNYWHMKEDKSNGYIKLDASHSSCKDACDILGRYLKEPE